ncbi:hypothetical protein [Luteibacter sp. UNCMF366Tsu5.1]|uniref:hypothetical protein n=1 Tax=Luteibacter sp. UNCMF366Tsu5.1 TaxID=1502758 RepID=UPI000908E60D|nr:hypothetical protein [Luteibacter sp. UNCMF366Tsu5.1]SFW36115.1 hypothetical protein SAMN02800691_1317 [Luteibacter sp. UNCMF366Tsu5.1]
MAAAPDRRQRLLGAMGITPWRLRVGGVAPEPEVAPANDTARGGSAVCVVVLPAGCSERELDLVGRALRAYGAVTGRAARLEVGERGLGDVPAARAYLVFGEAQARALGRDLPAAVMSAAQIVLVDTPSAILVDPAAKRRLWNGLRALGPTLRGA